MLGGIHFLTGSVLSLSLTSNSLSAFLIGVISHHFLDFLPHLDLNIFDADKTRSLKNWDKKAWILVIGEFFLFFFIALYFLVQIVDLNKQMIFLIGGLGGILPDILSLFFRYFLPKLKNNFYNKLHQSFHFKFQGNKNYFLLIFIELCILFFDFILMLGILSQ